VLERLEQGVCVQGAGADHAHASMLTRALRTSGDRCALAPRSHCGPGPGGRGALR
jgi:hypothetical protein